MPDRSVLLSGIGLHAGAKVEVRLARVTGPIVWAQGGAEAPQDELRATRTDRGLRVEAAGGRVSIDSVEHLLAALGGLGVHDGVRVEALGSEIPLLDGGARLFCEALFAIDAPCGRPSALRITQRATLHHGSSTYTFAPPEEDTPQNPARARLAVDVTFPAPVGHERDEWAGDPADFFARIAPSRTFGWARERDALLAQQRARGVDLGSVIVFGQDGPISGCRPNAPGEIARHKLLDLVGDLALYGGPPRGAVEAVAPGHTATHAVVAEALAAGILACDGGG